MAKDRVGSIHIAWSADTEARARKLARAKRQTLTEVFAAALELAKIRYDAEQAALALFYAGKRRA